MRCACSPSAPAWLSRRASTWSASSSPGLSFGLLDLVDHVPEVVGPAADLVPAAGERCFLGPERGQRGMRLGHGRPLAPRRGRRHRGCRAARRRAAATGSRAGRGGPPGARRAAASTEAVVGLPFTQARERPSAETSRRTTTRPSSTSSPSSSIRRRAAGVDALERALDDRLGRAGPHAAAGRPLAQQQRERVHQHRLAGAGLAGEHVEAGAELEGDIGDGGEIADPEFGRA